MKTKSEIIEFLAKNGINASIKPIMKVIDHKGNILAPERYCYKISYYCEIWRERKRLAVWPETVGYQGY